MKGVADALKRLSGVKRVTVKLQEGLVIAETDAAHRVLPSALWKEIARVGFVPARLEVWATGTFEADSFVLDGGRWLIEGRKPPAGERRRAHLRLLHGGEDPPHVEVLE